MSRSSSLRSTLLFLAFPLGAFATVAACAATPRDGTEAAQAKTPDARGDADAAETERSGLHRFCPDAGCAEGQECVSAPSPEGTTSTCEIACEDDVDCPDGMRCNVAPALPDTILDVCVER